MVICVCRYPIMITDKRFGGGDVFISLPLEVVNGIEVPIPDMEIVEEKGFDEKGTIGKYMKVKWQDDIPIGAKRYNVNEHIVIAGCAEEKLECDTKSIFAVYHPIDEWNEIHMIDLNEQTKNKK